MMRITGMTRFRKAVRRFKRWVQWYGRLRTLPLYEIYEYHTYTKLSTIIEWENNRFIMRYGNDDDNVWRDRNRVVLRHGIETETASETEE